MEALAFGFFQDVVVTAFLTLIVFFVLPRLLSQIAGNDSSTAANIADKQLPEKALGVSDLRLVPPCLNLDDRELKGIEKSGVFDEFQVDEDGVGVGVGGDAEPKFVEESGEIQEEIGSPDGDLIQRDQIDDDDIDHAVEEEGLGDWEGVERSELEKRFAAAMAFVESKSNADGVDGSLRLQLYALQRAAVEGPCHEPQPMALKVFARAKWKAWQKLGNMSGEMAMEQYMNLLSESIPKWEDQK